MFYDDLLIASKKRLKILIEELRKKRLLGRIKFSCAVRANLINEELCDLLKELVRRPFTLCSDPRGPPLVEQPPAPA